jgi:hypothetical protein
MVLKHGYSIWVFTGTVCIEDPRLYGNVDASGLGRGAYAPVTGGFTLHLHRILTLYIIFLGKLNGDEPRKQSCAH